MNKHNGDGIALTFIAIYSILIAVLLIGWLVNIYTIATSDVGISEYGAVEILRIVGIFIAPLGGILGWF